MSEGGGDIQALIGAMARLPGLGPRSARRIVLSLIGRRPGQMVQLSALMARVTENARPCSRCGNISDNDICPICADPAREIARLVRFLGAEPSPRWLANAARVPERRPPRWQSLPPADRHALSQATECARAALAALPAD